MFLMISMESILLHGFLFLYSSTFKLMHELNARAATKYNPTDAANEKKLLEVIAMQIN